MTRLSRFLPILAIAAFATACKQEAPPAFQRPPSPVTVAVAQQHDVPVYLDEIGRTQPSELVNIVPQVTGQIMKRYFEDGADIKINDPLYTIDTRNYQAKVSEMEAGVTQSQAMLELAQADFNRTKKAFGVGAANREDFDQKKGALDNAEAAVKTSQASLDTAKLTLSFCDIISPINGRAGQRLVDVGNVVKANETNLLVIQRLTPIYVDFTIVESNLPNLRAHMQDHTLQTNVGLPGSTETRPGELTFLDSNIQPNAGRINVRATLPNTDRYFWPGQFVNVRVVLNTIHDAVLIPFQCTQQGQQGMFVYVVKDDSTVEQRPITLGQRQQVNSVDYVVVEKGVKSGERIVLTGQLTIGPGAKVNVLPDPSAAAASQPVETAAKGGK